MLSFWLEENLAEIGINQGYIKQEFACVFSDLRISTWTYRTLLFNSAEFIFFFLPLTLIGFFILASKVSVNTAIFFLVVCSLFFYSWWNPIYLIILIVSMLGNYYLGRKLHETKSKKILFFGILLNLSALGYYKYAGFIVWNLAWLTGAEISIENIVLPLAISFFTFQQIAYLVDSWKGITEEYRFIHYALFVTFFPQLIAGPIVHHKEMLPQFDRKSTFSPNLGHVSIGLSIFAIGLFKKTIIADGMAVYANPVFLAADSGELPDFFLAWIGSLAYSFQLYFDFSGYSDMALGLARMFGIILPLNFYSPYKACSISEFWRRWHMTLSRFLRDYVYIPLGGNRHGQTRRYTYLMTTMLLGGLWHGAGWNFVIWGGLHGIYLVINHGWENLSKKFVWLRLPNSVYWAITMLAVVIGWVFFRATTLDGAINILAGMFGFNGFSLPNAILARIGDAGIWLRDIGVTAKSGGASQLTESVILITLLAFVVVAFPNVQDLFYKYKVSFNSVKEAQNEFWLFGGIMRRIKWSPNWRWAVALSITFVLSLMTLGQISDFLYFQF